MSDWNLYNGPAMDETQLRLYLARIGLAGAISLDLNGLSRLHLAHKRTVPFENLDILAGRPLSLDHEALFQKIVLRRQGGVCAELNTLYNWLLYSLGFSVTSFNARIITGDVPEFRRHRVLAVTFGEETYTTDVGYTTENARIPLLLKEGFVQDDGCCLYRYERDEFYGWVQWQKKPGEDWTRSLGFRTEEPQLDVDFILPMFYYEKSSLSNMNKVCRVSIYTEDGILAIRARNNGTATQYLQEKAGIIQTARPLTDREEELWLLREVFHLDVTGL